MEKKPKNPHTLKSLRTETSSSKPKPYPIVHNTDLVSVWNSINGKWNLCVARGISFLDDNNKTVVPIRVKSGHEAEAFWNKDQERFEYMDYTIPEDSRLLPVLAHDLKSFVLLKPGEAYFILHNKNGEVMETKVTKSDFEYQASPAIRFQSREAAKTYFSLLFENK